MGPYVCEKTQNDRRCQWVQRGMGKQNGLVPLMKMEMKLQINGSWYTLLSRKSKLMWKMSIVTCSAWMRSLKWSHLVRLAAWTEEKMSFLHLSINVQSDYTFTGKGKHTDLKQTFRVIYFCVCLSRKNETADEMSYHVIWLNSCISVWWVYGLDW